MTKKSIGSLISNLVICAVVVIVFAVSFAPNALTVSNGDNPIYKGNSENKVSLMVNVYWGTEYIPEMLDIFSRYGVKTTFFVGGMWACENEAILKDIYAAGHEIGNHGYYHKDHKKLDYNRNKEEMEITHKVVKSILDYDMKLFAPPSGSYGNVTLQVAEELGYKTIMWTLDTIDWRDQDESLIIKRATEKITGGALVLMHPTKATVSALDRILAAITQKGLAVAPVSEVIQTLQISL
ncbi:MAG: polysaccharide deacetylase family protein [Clostridiales bacterium]|nr:polysaccharide deacetylase family protein [Clostridiales bacterium]